MCWHKNSSNRLKISLSEVGCWIAKTYDVFRQNTRGKREKERERKRYGEKNRESKIGDKKLGRKARADASGFDVTVTSSFCGSSDGVIVRCCIEHWSQQFNTIQPVSECDASSCPHDVSNQHDCKQQASSAAGRLRRHYVYFTFYLRQHSF